MSINSKITKNSLIQIAGKMISLVLGLVAVSIMTRYLGQTGFGYYTTAIAFLQFFGIMADFGLSLTTVQMISDEKQDEPRLLKNILTLRVISSFLFIGLAPLVVLFFPYPPEVKMGVLATSFSFYFITIIQVLTGVFQKKLKMFEVTIAEVLGRLVLVILTAVIALLGGSLFYILLTISFGSLVNLIVVFYYARKYIEFGWAFDFDIWKAVAKRSWPIALSIGFNLIYLKMDTIILSLVRPQADVGLYGATYRVVDILTMMPAVYMGIVLPHLTNHFLQKNLTEMKKLMQLAFDSLMLFAVPIVFGTFLVAQKVMVFVAGRDFAMSGEILKVLILASGAIFVTSLFGYAVLAVHKQRQMMWGYLTTSIITLIGYFIFIPKFGFWGAAWMTVFSEVVIMVWTFVVVYRETKFIPSLIALGKYCLAGLVMVGIILLLPNWHILFVLLMASITYFGMLYLLGAIKKDFWKELSKPNIDNL